MGTKRILVVDDDVLMLKLINHILKGFEVIEASDAKKALEILDRHNPIDLIITDYHMPLSNGLEFASLIKSNKQYSHTPIVLITSDINITYEGEFKVFNEIIHKPFSNDFLARITALLC